MFGRLLGATFAMDHGHPTRERDFGGPKRREVAHRKRLASFGLADSGVEPEAEATSQHGRPRSEIRQLAACAGIRFRVVGQKDHSVIGYLSRNDATDFSSQ